MRFVSWNVNGIRSCARKGFLDWLDRSAADVVALQEVRARPDQLEPDLLAPLGWNVALTPAERAAAAGANPARGAADDRPHASRTWRYYQAGDEASKNV